MKTAIIGCGHLGSILARALAAAPLGNSTYHGRGLHLVERNPQSAQALAQELNASFETQASAAVSRADVVILAVRPQDFAQASIELAPHIEPKQLIISVLAGVRLATLAKALPRCTQIVRAMPNLPALVHQAITALVASPQTASTSVEQARAIFESVGKTILLHEEAQIDAVTAISGSGPGYVFYLAQALSEAAQSIGLEAEVAETLVRETFYGSAALWCSGPAGAQALRSTLTKGGGTEAAFKAFDDEKIAERLAEGVKAAWRRYIELSGKVTTQ